VISVFGRKEPNTAAAEGKSVGRRREERVEEMELKNKLGMPGWRAHRRGKVCAWVGQSIGATPLLP
jgi:hypothetical protein